MNEQLFRLLNGGIRNGFFDRVMPILSDRDYIALPALLAFVLAWAFGRRTTRACLVALVIALAIADRGSENALKNLFSERRPYATLENVHVHRAGAWAVTNPDASDPRSSGSNSFPSTHATDIAAVTVVLAFLSRKTLWGTIPLALLVGLSRVYTGNHYPADVLAGYAWGGLTATVVTLIVLAIARRIWARRPAEEPRPPMAQDQKAFLWLLALWGFINFTFVYLNHFCLAEDEAQYWDWSRHYALGYYSKPPMIAYFMRALTHAMGNKEWAIRSGAVMCSAGTLALIYGLTLRITKRERTALIAVCLMIAMPFTWAGSVILTIDPLLAFFWALAMYAFHRAANGERNFWWLAGLALGCGMLSKYTILLLVVSFALYLLVVDRKPLRTFGPYAAIAVMLLCMSGVIYWNATNDWVSLRHTASIGAGVSRAFGKTLQRVGEYFGAQAGIASPILFGMFIWGMVQAARRWRQNRDAAYLFLCGAVLFIFYAYVSLTHRPEPNWPICSYLAAVPAFAWMWSERAHGPRMRKLLVAGVILGCLMGIAVRSTNVIYLLADTVGGKGSRADRIKIGPLSIDPDRDPTNRLIGGRELGAALAKYGVDENDPLFIFTPRYQLTAWAAFYTPGHPRAYYVNPEERYNQYDLWGGWDKLVGQDALFVAGGDDALAQQWIGEFVSHKAFESGECLETVKVYRGKTLIKQYSISRLHRYTGYEWAKETQKF